MNTLKWSLVTIGVALLGAVAGYRWAQHSFVDSGTATGASSTVTPAAADGGRKILYWHDPMKPEVRFDKPGKSPFMNMELVPVYADAGDGSTAGGISVPSKAQQSLGIRIGRVEKASLAPRFTAVGTVSYDEHALALVQARVAGFVTRLHVRAALDRVRRGDVLADVTAPAWTEAEGEYLTLLGSESASSVALRAAARQRLAVLGVPEATIQELEKTRNVPASTSLVAPIGGVVTELGLRDGANFKAGAVLFRINGTATVWITVQLPEAQAGVVSPGATVEVRAAAVPGKVFTGRVQALLPQLDTATRTVGVRIAIDNSADTLHPGMFVQATLVSAAAAPQLWVPSEAIIATGERTVVITQGADGAFNVVNVTTGTETDGKTAIRSGLTEGQAVVLSGQFLIDSEANLRSAINRLSAAPATPASTP